MLHRYIINKLQLHLSYKDLYKPYSPSNYYIQNNFQHKLCIQTILDQRKTHFHIMITSINYQNREYNQKYNLHMLLSQDNFHSFLDNFCMITLILHRKTHIHKHKIHLRLKKYLKHKMCTSQADHRMLSIHCRMLYTHPRDFIQHSESLMFQNLAFPCRCNRT